MAEAEGAAGIIDIIARVCCNGIAMEVYRRWAPEGRRRVALQGRTAGPVEGGRCSVAGVSNWLPRVIESLIHITGDLMFGRMV